MVYDITCVITGHREGHIAVASLRSFQAAIACAEKRGISVETLFFLDKPDATTQRLFERFDEGRGNVHVCDFADQGAVRNTAVAAAKGTYCAFLDADDLWTEDWLVQAFEFLADKPKTVIAHPAANYFFESQATIYRHIDQESPEFRPDLLRVANYWDALCLCPTEIYREIPFSARDIAGGWAYEDWQWNCETVSAGKIHKVVPGSVLFKRRQRTSQTIIASTNKSLIKRTPLSAYDHPLYSGQAD